MQTFGYAAQSAGVPLAPFTFQRRALRANDVAMEILYCCLLYTSPSPRD